MSIKNIILATDQFYHIFNKTVGSELVFAYKSCLDRVLGLCDFYRIKSNISFSNFKNLSSKAKLETMEQIDKLPKLVDIFAFSFMPNHYHFLLRQLKDDGINFFISNFQNAFAKFFNTKYNRKGSLFCHPFKRVRLETEEQFNHVSRYIHLNPVTSYIMKFNDLIYYSYNSYSSYMGKTKIRFINKEIIFNYFKTVKRYNKFVEDQEDYQKKLKKIKNLLLE